MIRGNNHANDFCCISDRVRTYIGLLILELSINCLLITLVPSCSVCQFSEIFSNASLSFALSHTVSKRWSFVLFAKKNSSSFALSCTVSQPFSFLLFAQNSSPLTTYPHLCLLFFFLAPMGSFPFLFPVPPVIYTALIRAHNLAFPTFGVILTAKEEKRDCGRCKM